MNTKRLKAYLVRGIISLSVVLAALMTVKGQSDLGVRVSVPFDFTVGDQRLPAGEYTLRPYTTGLGVLRISNWQARRSLIFSANVDEHLVSQGDARLIFDRYEDQYFLREVWMTGAESYDLPKSRIERSLEKDLARDVPRRVEVVQITDITQ